MFVCACVCVSGCVRACVLACVRVCAGSKHIFIWDIKCPMASLFSSIAEICDLSKSYCFHNTWLFSLFSWVGR